MRARWRKIITSLFAANAGERRIRISSISTGSTRKTDLGKLVVLFHGLEGCSQSHYARALMQLVRDQGWRGVVPHFRGCSGEANRLVRSYHSGDSREIDSIIRRLKNENSRAEIYVAGVSLGGNMLLKWLGEEGGAARSVVERAVAVSAPVGSRGGGASTRLRL